MGNLLEIYSTKRINENFKYNFKSRESYLESVAKEFISEKIYYSLQETLTILKNPIFNNLPAKLSKLVVSEGNTVQIPISEFTNTINFTIFVEADKIFRNSKDDSINISKFSSMMESKFNSESETELHEETYKSERIVEAVTKMASKYTNDLEIKNDYLIISFN